MPITPQMLAWAAMYRQAPPASVGDLLSPADRAGYCRIENGAAAGYNRRRPETGPFERGERREAGWVKTGVSGGGNGISVAYVREAALREWAGEWWPVVEESLRSSAAIGYASESTMYVLAHALLQAGCPAEAPPMYTAEMLALLEAALETQRHYDQWWSEIGEAARLAGKDVTPPPRGRFRIAIS